MEMEARPLSPVAYRLSHRRFAVLDPDGQKNSEARKMNAFAVT